MPCLISNIVFEQGGHLEALLLPSQQILVSIFDDSGSVLRQFLTQNFVLHSENRTNEVCSDIFIGWYSNGSFRVFLDDLNLAESTSSTEVVIAPVKSFSPQETSSLWHPASLKVCSVYILERSTLFKNLKPKSLGRTPKSEREIIESLAEATQRLLALSEMSLEGDRKWVGPILAELRALLYFRPSNNNYYPLLLQVADIKKLPLPVYIHKERNIDDRFTNKEVRFRLGAPPRIYSYADMADLTDIQEWLGSEMVRTFNSEPLTANEFILNCAVTMGSVHYDPQNLNSVVDISRMVGNRDYLDSYFLELAQTVGELSSWVLFA